MTEILLLNNKMRMFEIRKLQEMEEEPNSKEAVADRLYAISDEADNLREKLEELQKTEQKDFFTKMFPPKQVHSEYACIRYRYRVEQTGDPLQDFSTIWYMVSTKRPDLISFTERAVARLLILDKRFEQLDKLRHSMKRKKNW